MKNGSKMRGRSSGGTPGPLSSTTQRTTLSLHSTAIRNTRGFAPPSALADSLLKAIMRPAMIAVWVLGLTLALTPGIVDWRSDGWIYVKLATVLALTWYHHWLLARWKDFEQDRNTLTGRRYRAMNELPTLALIVIVIMVVVRPF